MINAGELNRRIRLQSPSTNLDPSGAPDPSYKTYATVYASREGRRVDEEFQDVGEQSRQHTNWKVRHRTDISAEDRIVDVESTSVQWDVIGAYDPDGLKEELIIETVRN